MSEQNNISNEQRAIILRFPKRRGRPKAPRREYDCGTPELMRKKQSGETSEALDLLLERGIINEAQHRCGIHLRWLYTLRHGAPGIRALDLTDTDALRRLSDDPEWREAREKEYTDAMERLAPTGCAPLLLNICVHNERPHFLRTVKTSSQKSQQSALREIEQLCQALNLLEKHWKKRIDKNTK